ncbi:hypothetical protein [Kineococcus sp. SYSU DK006]|uniref:hypothetical protein n=1 Tax=Kineococcus sp. SYSU DK006 TaxID=3383127 RepID=UPI003D7DA8B9
MRRLLARLLLVAGLGCAVAGALLLTVLAPPAHIDVAEESADPGVAVVSAPGLLELSGPTARVRASAPAGTDVFVGVARAVDVRAWLAQARHTEVTAVAGTLEEPAARTRVQGEGAAADPRAADIWLQTSTGDASAELTWSTAGDDDLADAGGVVVLAATDGSAPAPQRVDFRWRAEGDAAEHPAGTPLLVAGAVAALLGVAGVLVTARRARRAAARPGTGRRA